MNLAASSALVVMKNSLRRTLLSLACSVVGLANLSAQGAWSDQFDRPGLLGRVFALGEYQGQLVAGGTGVEGDGETSFGLTAIYDGTHWKKMGPGIYSGSPAQVRAFTEFNGELIVGGQFCCAGSTTIQSIARWDGQQWLDLGSGIDGIVHALTTYNGELYAAGAFDNAGGVSVANIARWDGSQWHPVGGGLDKFFEPIVLELQVGPDGLLYACGEFDTAGGSSAANIARWDGTNWSALGSGLPGALNGYVWDLEWFQNELYAAGNFDLIAGGGTQEKVARWNGVSWSAAGNFPDSSIGTFVTSLSVLGGKLYAGGNVVSADGVTTQRIAVFDGNSWGFTGGVSGSGQITSIWAQIVYAGSLVVGGEFSVCGMSQAAGQGKVSQSVASFDGATWSAIGEGAGFNAVVKEAVLWNGRVVATGPFSEAGSQVVGGPVIFDGQDWSSLASFGGGSVKSLLVWNADLIVGGDFTSVNGMALGNVVRFDGSQWTGFPGGAPGDALEVYQGQLYAGGLGGVLRWNGASWESFAPQIFGQLYDLHEHAGVLYMSGSMFGDGNLVSWDGTTQQTVNGGTNGSVYCLASFEGDLLLGGVFTQAGGVSANRLARWNGTGFSEFGGISGTTVDSLAVLRGELYASGNLIVPGLPANKYIARWNGTAWKALGTGFGSGGQAGTLVADDAGGHLYAGGIISHAGDLPSWYFARWDTNPGSLGTPYCFGDGNGAICPCGNFGSASEHGCANSSFGEGASLDGTGVASISADSFELTATASVPGAAGLFFQGSSRANGGNGSVLGDGLLCAGGQIQRLGVAFGDNSGVVQSGVGLGLAASAVPGTEHHYQWWYRDPVGSPCGSGFNLSNGLSVTWLP